MEVWRWIWHLCLALQLLPEQGLAKPQLVYPDFFRSLPEPDGCDGGLTFCGGDETKYPKNEINEIVDKTIELKQSPEAFERFFQQLLRSNVTGDGNVRSDSLPLEEGLGRDLLDMKPSCTSRTEIIPRFSRAKNVLGKWMYLVDGTSGRQQNVEITICDHPDHVCNNDLDSPYGPGTTICKQLYRTHKMLAVDKGGEVVVDTFELPSACVCNYKSSFDLGFRMGEDSFQPFRDILCSVSEVTEPIVSEFDNVDESQTTTLENQPEEEKVPAKADEMPAFSTADPEGASSDKILFHEPEPCGTETEEGFYRICEDPLETAFYPEMEMKKLLRNHPTFRSPDLFEKLFGKPCEFGESLTKFRVGFELTESPLCTSFESYIFPKVAKNIKGLWRYIVNTREYRQGVTIETCHKKAIGASCTYGGREGLKPEATVCRQLYTHHNLLTLTESGLLEYETFLIPSACSCYLTESPYTPLFPGH